MDNQVFFGINISVWVFVIGLLLRVERKMSFLEANIKILLERGCCDEQSKSSADDNL